MRVRRVVVAGLLGLVALLVAYVSASPARSDGAAAATRTIGTVSTSDFRVVLTATRLGGGGAPSASVTVRTSERASAGWRRTGTHRLAGSYFWKTLAGPRAVCRLEVRTGAPGPRFEPRALVQLLVTPSLGCGPVSEMALG